jgi:Lrp/AsnC family transcriptional regulator
VQRMQQHKIILRQAVVVDPQRVGLAETFFISIRTNQHNALWLEHFSAIIKESTAILEAHRLAGDADYLLKVQVSSTREFDLFYKQLVASIDLYNVTSSLSMEVIKHETALPV